MALCTLLAIIIFNFSKSEIVGGRYVGVIGTVSISKPKPDFHNKVRMQRLMFFTC